MRPNRTSQRCLALTRCVADATVIANAPFSKFQTVHDLPLPGAIGAYVLGLEGFHNFGSTINAQVGGHTTVIGWRLYAGDPARKLVDILVDTNDPLSVVQAAEGRFVPAPEIIYIPPHPKEGVPDLGVVRELSVPQAAQLKVSRGPWSRSIYELVRDTAKENDIPPAFLLALVHVESNFNPHAFNAESGAMGLTQLIPTTAQRFGVTDPFDPRQNLIGAIGYLKVISHHVDSPHLVLAAYHSGLHGVQSHGITSLDWRYIRQVETQWKMYEAIARDALTGEDPIGDALLFAATK